MQEYSDTLTKVEFYTVIINPVIIMLSADSSCGSTGCYHSFDFNLLNHTETNISVMITATNAVGESLPATCSDQHICKWL